MAAAKGRKRANTPTLAAQSGSLSGQLKHYARLGLIAGDNPDLPLSLIEGIWEARTELRAGLGQPYQWGVLNGGRAEKHDPDRRVPPGVPHRHIELEDDE